MESSHVRVKVEPLGGATAYRAFSQGYPRIPPLIRGTYQHQPRHVRWCALAMIKPLLTPTQDGQAPCNSMFIATYTALLYDL